MDIDRIKKAIAELSGSRVSAKLRQVMPDIEQKVQDGVPHEEIVAALQEAGIDVSLETFRKNLYRYRAKLRQAGRATPRRESAAPTNGNSSADNPREDDPPAPGSDDQFEATLDPKSRDALGEKYLARRPNLLGKNRSGKR